MTPERPRAPKIPAIAVLLVYAALGALIVWSPLAGLGALLGTGVIAYVLLCVLG